MRSRLAYPAFRRFVRGLMWLLCRTRFEGNHELPPGGPLILAANHQSYLDPFLLGIGIRLRPRYLVFTTFMRMPVVSTFCRAFGGLEVGHGPPARSLRLARGALFNGDVLEIFPEGERSLDGSVLPFARGFAQLARITSTPVIPVAIMGAEEVWPPSRRLPRPGRVCVRYGAALRHPGSPDLVGEEARAADREFASRVRQTVLRLANGRLTAHEDLSPARPPSASGMEGAH